MSEIELMLSCALCCFQCGECCKEHNGYKGYKENNENKELLCQSKNIDVKIYHSDYNDNKENDSIIDTNIHRIIFYNQYSKGYYDSFNIIDIKNKDILILFNETLENSLKTIDFIYANKGISFKDGKWFPKNIWIFNKN